VNEQEILKLYESMNAVWFFDYNGNPKAPHAELTSGLCSDGYINSAPILADPIMVEILAGEIIKRLPPDCCDWVVGSAYAAITLSYEVARQLNGVSHGFVEKDPENPKRMCWKRLVIPEGEIVLQCEELITTLGTTMEVRRAINEENPEPVTFLPVVTTSIYRPSEKLQASSIDVTALVTKIVQTWQPEKCPLCAAGSHRLRPKQNWVKLTVH